MAYETWHRPLSGVVLPSYRYWYESSTFGSGPGFEILQGSQSTYSWRTSPQQSKQMEYEQMTGSELKREVNREYRDRNDNGHPFWTESDSWTWNHPSVAVDATNGVHYVGFLSVGTTGANDLPDFSLPTANKITLDGTEGVRRTYPTRPEAGLAQFLGELREGLPHLPGALAGIAKYRSAGMTSLPKRLVNLLVGKGNLYRSNNVGEIFGDEYLNIVFGLLPTSSDIQKMARMVIAGCEAARQMRRDSGRQVRRKANLYDRASSISRSDEVLSLAMGSVSGTSRPSGYLSTYSPLCSVVDLVQQRAWFSGAYEYHLAQGHSFLAKIDRYEQLANHLLGSRITPELIWELTPWSWLIDWFVDSGDFLANVSALHDDDLVLKYGYVMHETRATRTWTSRSSLRAFTGKEVAERLVLTHSYVRKERTRATPYGFGVDVESLSPQRWAILGALGLTKGPTTIRTD